ncbi:cupin domain-containing protein [Candidatus Bipolaricaulota bacterium]
MSGLHKVGLADVEAFRHGKDGYYYRPLVFGENIFLYVAHIPPGGEMPPDPEEAKLFELVFLMLEGDLEISDGSETIAISADMALHIPRGTPFGTRNVHDKTASFVMAFSPPPRLKSLEEFKEIFAKENLEVVPADDADSMRYLQEAAGIAPTPDALFEHERMVRLADVEGFKHGNDDYFFRPLCFGKEVYMYVAHVPPGGVMPPDPEEANLFEGAVYMLDGSLEISDGESTFMISAEEALHVPKGVPFGVANRGKETASLVMSFTPASRRKSVAEFREEFARQGLVILSADDTNQMRQIGKDDKE